MPSGLIAAKTSSRTGGLRSVLRGCSVLVFWVALTTGSVAAQQTSYCRTAADTAGSFLASLKGSYDVVDTVWMKSQGQPFAAPTAITLVTQSNTCKAAVAAYNQASGITPALTSVYVAALGKQGFVVMNPREQAGEFQAMWVFDTKWAMKQRIYH